MCREIEPALCHVCYRGVRLDGSDAEAGRLLSDEAQWNQTENDWNFLLSVGRGFGFEDSDGTLTASTVALPYGGRIAWIGMVLVSAPARRQGLARLLLRHVVTWCQKQGLVPLLDATPAGRTVYLSLGFTDLRTITRWRRATSVASQPEKKPARLAGMIGAFRVDLWAGWDELRFGADRRALLQMLESSRPDVALQLLGKTGEPCGYCLGRTGRIATQIGPVLAETERDALALLESALDRVRGPILMDVPDGRTLFERKLRAGGFQPERHFTRMACGSVVEFGLPECVFAIAGPEFG